MTEREKKILNLNKVMIKNFFLVGRVEDKININKKLMDEKYIW